MIISNNALNLFDNLPSDLIIRINIAWCNNIIELKAILENATSPIYFDFPSGRTKPPKPKLSIDDVIKLANSYQRVKYFAFSNAEKVSDVQYYRSKINKNIKLVPKIETVKGIENMVEICKGGETDMIMLDHEDLYVNVDHDSDLFNKYMNICIKKGKEHNIKIYKVQGVIFDEIKS